MHLIPYPKYKDSGVEWLGEIPEGWNLSKLKYWSLYKKGKYASILTKDYIGLNIGEYPVYSGQTENDGIMGEINWFEFDFQTIVILVTTVGAKAMTTKCLIGKFSLSQNCALIIPKNLNLNSVFFDYLLQPLFDFEKGLISTIMQPSLRFEDLDKYPIPLPPLDEQKAIATFLDRETAKIDTIIAKQEQLIVLLEEKRQALISHAVTKGLDPNVKMKDSGVEWLGEIPEGWKLKKLKYIFKIKKRIAGKLGYEILSITQRGIRIKDISNNEGQISMDYSKYQLVYPGDFAMNHMDLLTGSVDISNVEGVTSPDYRVFVLTEKDCYPEYYKYVLLRGYTDRIFYNFGQGSSHLGRWRLPTEQFEAFMLPFPNYKEQKKIADFINMQLEKSNSVIRKVTLAIEILKEKRSALISSVVTGKIDVRGML